MADFFSTNLSAPSGAPKNAYLAWSQMLAQEKPAEAAWTVPEAFFAILFAAATCDESMTREEHETMLVLAHRSRALQSLRPEQLAALNERVAQRFYADRKDALAKSCAILPAENRLPAFAHALDVVLADGDLAAKEAEFLNDLMRGLQLEAADVQRVADVLMMKNSL